jgi:DNA mismatch repair protein MutS
LDEVGRGTSTEDGLAIASAVLENLATKVQSWTLFATHYHELVHFAKNFSLLKTYQMEVIEKNDSIKFTHRLIEGASGSSYGIQVAKLAGIPEIVTERAHSFLHSSQKNTVKQFPIQTFEKKETCSKCEKFSGFMENISMNRTTPIQAFNILNKLKDGNYEDTKRSLFHDGQSLF